MSANGPGHFFPAWLQTRTIETANDMNEQMADRAEQVYDLVEHRMNRLKRWAMMGFFWAVALISMGNASPVPSTKAWAIVRKSDGTVVTTVDDEMAGENSVRPQLDADLRSMTVAEFDEAWGISSGP